MLLRSRKTIGFATALAACLSIAAPAGAATITPDIATDEFTIADDPNCSLREAVVSLSENGSVGGCDANVTGVYGSNDTIVLAGDYQLSLSGAGEDDGLTGDLDVTGALTIRGVGIEYSLVAQSVADRIFHLQTGGSRLALENVTLSGGESGGEGGGILAEAAGNDVVLVNSTIANGEALSGAGARVEGAGSTLTATDTTFSNNVASGSGGGASIASNATATFTRAFFHLNAAETNAPNGQPSGGALQAFGADMTITDSTFSENSVSATSATADWALGGAIRTNAEALVEGTLFEENSVATGGDATGMERGGAVYLEQPGLLDVANSTFFGNEAGNGNVPGEAAGGGAVYKSGANADVRFSTFLLNGTSGDGAESLDNGNSGGPLTFSANLFAVTEDVCEGDNDATLVSEGHNVAPPDAQCQFTGTDDVGPEATALLVGTPAVNGGPTRTVALQATGRGLDAVPFASCAAGSGGFDARDYPRLGGGVGSACDAGAYERTTCNGVLQNVDFTACVTPVANPPVPAKKCAGKKGKKRKRCLCKQKKGKKRKKCLRKLKKKKGVRR